MNVSFTVIILNFKSDKINFIDSPKNWKLLHYSSMIASASGVILLLISRGHYTIDVIVSYWITTRVFWQYHTMAGIAVLRVSVKIQFYETLFIN